MIWIIDNFEMMKTLVRQWSMVHLRQFGVTFWLMLGTNNWENSLQAREILNNRAHGYNVAARFEITHLKTHLSKQLFEPIQQTFFPRATTIQWENDLLLPVEQATEAYYRKKTRHVAKDAKPRFNLLYFPHVNLLQFQEQRENAP